MLDLDLYLPDQNTSKTSFKETTVAALQVELSTVIRATATLPSLSSSEVDIFVERVGSGDVAHQQLLPPTTSPHRYNG